MKEEEELKIVNKIIQRDLFGFTVGDMIVSLQFYQEIYGYYCCWGSCADDIQHLLGRKK